MTTINPAVDIPASVNTLTKLHIWSGLALQFHYNSIEAVEGPGITERVIQVGSFFIPSENKYRILTRASIELTPAFLVGGAKQWTYAQNFGSTALDNSFKS
jgi:hypothetical protein